MNEVGALPSTSLRYFTVGFPINHCPICYTRHQSPEDYQELLGPLLLQPAFSPVRPQRSHSEPSTSSSATNLVLSSSPMAHGSSVGAQSPQELQCWQLQGIKQLHVLIKGQKKYTHTESSSPLSWVLGQPSQKALAELRFLRRTTSPGPLPPPFCSHPQPGSANPAQAGG